jgi:drug/metabolite transporter (DMT)-like permease
MSLGAGIMLVAALSYAFGYVIVRRLGTTESMEAIVFYFCLFNSTFSFIAALFWGLKMPQGEQWLWLLAIGISGGIGQMFISQGSRIAEATLIAPFEYVSIIWATLIGFMAFGDIPSIYTYIGSVIVIAAGLLVLYRERKLGIERARE